MVSEPVPVSERAEEIVEQIENYEALEGDDRLRTGLKFNDDKLQKYPYRDPEKLQVVWDECDQVQEVAAEFGVRPHTIGKWLHVFGFRERRSDATIHAHDIRELSPSDVGLDDDWPEGEA